MLCHAAEYLSGHQRCRQTCASTFYSGKQVLNKWLYTNWENIASANKIQLIASGVQCLCCFIYSDQVALYEVYVVVAMYSEFTPLSFFPFLTYFPVFAQYLFYFTELLCSCKFSTTLPIFWHIYVHNVSHSLFLTISPWQWQDVGISSCRNMLHMANIVISRYLYFYKNKKVNKRHLPSQSDPKLVRRGFR